MDDSRFSRLENRVDEIINAIGESIVIEKKQVGAGNNLFKSGLIVSMVRQDLSQILKYDHLSPIISVSEGEPPFKVTWLTWLLTAGDSFIINDYHIEFGVGYGRSGVAKMEDGGGWRVPPKHSGTKNNNWITRTLRSKTFINELTAIMTGILK